MSEQISAALDTSFSSHTESISQTYYGFVPQHTFLSVDDIAPIEEEYKASLHDQDRNDDEIVQVSVSSWDSLDEVYDLLHANDTIIPSTLSLNSDLGVIYKEAYFTNQSARNFIDNKNYVGYYQFDQMNKLREAASNLLQEIIDLVEGAKNGTEITSAMISDYYEKSSILNNDLQEVSNTFALSWYYTFTEEAHPVNALTNIDGTTPVAIYDQNLRCWGIGGTTLLRWTEGLSSIRSYSMFNTLMVGYNSLELGVDTMREQNSIPTLQIVVNSAAVGTPQAQQIPVGESMNSTEVNDLTERAQYAEVIGFRATAI
jgi:hypothetical protein